MQCTSVHTLQQGGSCGYSGSKGPAWCATLCRERNKQRHACETNFLGRLCSVLRGRIVSGPLDSIDKQFAVVSLAGLARTQGHAPASTAAKQPCSVIHSARML